MAGARRRSYEFDPTPHERELSALIDALVALPELDARGIDRVVKRHPREGRGFFSKSQIIKVLA